MGDEGPYAHGDGECGAVRGPEAGVSPRTFRGGGILRSPGSGSGHGGVAGDEKEDYQGREEECGVDDEDRVGAPRIPQDAGDGRADERCDGDQSAGEAHGAPPPAGCRPVADDRERARREHGSANAVNRPCGDHLGRGLDYGVAQDGEDGYRHADYQGSAASPPVEDEPGAQVSEQVGEGVGRDDESDEGGRRPKLLGMRSYRRELHEQVEECSEYHEPSSPRCAACDARGLECS